METQYTGKYVEKTWLNKERHKLKVIYIPLMLEPVYR